MDSDLILSNKPMDIRTPIDEETIKNFQVGDRITVSGSIFCGRDAVLPRIAQMIRNGTIRDAAFDLCGGLVFHTAVSPAGIGPTSSNKLEIESTMGILSSAGIRMHLGKGKISPRTVEELRACNAVYAIIPPVTALLGAKTSNIKCIAFPELGMEALYSIDVDRIPVIIAAAHGRSIYDE